jgi:hypothetical protein
VVIALVHASGTTASALATRSFSVAKRDVAARAISRTSQ